MGIIKTAGLAGGMLCLALLTSACGGYYAGVSYGPPAPIVESPYGYAPGPGYIWTPGYYEYGGGNWAWRRGSWRRPPHASDRWIAPRYDHRGNGYRYRAGGWQHGNHMHH